MRLTTKNGWRRLGAVLCCLIMLVSCCGCGASDSDGSTDDQPAVLDLSETERLERLRSEMASRLPARYCTGDGFVPGQPVPEVEGNPDKWLFAQQMKLLEPAVSLLTDEETALVNALMSYQGSGAAGDVSSADVQSAGWSGAGIDDIAGLYKYVLNLENDLISKVAVDFTPGNEDSFRVMPVFTTDDSGDIWLTLYTNFRLPGFEDSKQGYMLRLDLDGGTTEQVTADSIYSHGNIRNHGSYSVSFNLSKTLGKVTAAEYLAGRNRVTFSLFELDNSYSYSCEFYKLRYADSEFSDLARCREELAKIILDAV